MKKFLAIALVTMLALTAFVGCGSDKGDTAANDATYAGQGTAVDGDTIYLGVFEPTTGENGGGGLQEVLGARYANTVAPTVDIDGKTYVSNG